MAILLRHFCKRIGCREVFDYWSVVMECSFPTCHHTFLRFPQMFSIKGLLVYVMCMEHSVFHSLALVAESMWGFFFGGGGVRSGFPPHLLPGRQFGKCLFSVCNSVNIHLIENDMRLSRFYERIFC